MDGSVPFSIHRRGQPLAAGMSVARSLGLLFAFITPKRTNNLAGKVIHHRNNIEINAYASLTTLHHPLTLIHPGNAQHLSTHTGKSDMVPKLYTSSNPFRTYKQKSNLSGARPLFVTNKF